MRYDVPIYFQKITSGEYDPSTGNYADDTVEETLQYASVMDTGTETMVQVYGSIRQGSLTIQIQNHYLNPFDQVRVGQKIYHVDLARKLRTKHTFIVSEVQ